MRGKVWLLITSLIFCCETSFSLEFKNNSKAILIMNAKTGHVLFERNGYESVYPASTTKIATALFFIRKYSDLLTQKTVIKQDFLTSITPQAKRQSNYRSPPHWLETDGSQIGLKAKEDISVYDLLNATLICSGNDAANCLAGTASGSIPTFLEEMNLFLRSIGCHKTNFKNPHGLHHPDHITTAYDLAIMAREGLQDPLFHSIVSSVSYKASPTNLEDERIFSQTNRLLLSKSAYYYPYAYGVKTGSTKDAGKNLIAAAERNNRSLIGVIMGCQDSSDTLYKDMIGLFDAAFNEQKNIHYLLEPQTTLSMSFPGIRRKIHIVLTEGLSYEYFPSEPPHHPRMIFEKNETALPLKPGDLLGRLKIIDETGKILTVKDIPTEVLITADRFSCQNLRRLLRSKKILSGIFILLPILGYIIKTLPQRKKTVKKSSYF